MAQDIYTQLEGKLVTIDKLTGAFRRCGRCDGETATVSTSPVGMHQGHLTCTSCGNFTSYLSRDHLSAMLAAHSVDGGEDAA